MQIKANAQKLVRKENYIIVNNEHSHCKRYDYEIKIMKNRLTR